jgi:hypothetical protein
MRRLLGAITLARICLLVFMVAIARLAVPAARRAKVDIVCVGVAVGPAVVAFIVRALTSEIGRDTEAITAAEAATESEEE